MNVTDTTLPDVRIIEPVVHEDGRGWFSESWNQATLRDVLGRKVDFVQDNHSMSHRWVLRGLHYQLEHPVGKLVRVIRGEVFDVAVDIRASSPTFGKWLGTTLSATNHRQLWVPEGFAHGFLVLSDEAEVLYKVTTHWSKDDDHAIRWNDSAIGIDWPLEHDVQPILAERDAAAPHLADAPCLP